MQHPLRHLARARPPLAPHAPPLTRPLSLPTILRPTFWSSLVPKPLRTPSSSSSPTSPPPPRTRPRAPNPAIPYIIFSLLIGSQAIQTLWLKQERARRARRAEAHMEVLRGVIERVKEGGHVDVEGMLGVGVREEESRWWEVLRELRDEEALFQSVEDRRVRRRAKEEEEEEEQEVRDSERGGGVEEKHEREKTGEEACVKVESLGGVRFY